MSKLETLNAKMFIAWSNQVVAMKEQWFLKVAEGNGMYASWNFNFE